MGADVTESTNAKIWQKLFKSENRKAAIWAEKFTNFVQFFFQKIHNFLKGTGFFGKNQNPGIANFFLLKVAKKIPRDAQKVATTAFA